MSPPQATTRGEYLGSLIAHALLALPFLVMMLSPNSPRVESQSVPFEVIENPVLNTRAAPKPLELRPSAPRPPAEPAARKVFGLSRKALTTTGPADSPSVEMKAGNTLATAPDDKKLLDSDRDLPVPLDEYLVSSLPRLLEGVEVPYPPRARASGFEGSVKLRILIDASGAVRTVEVLETPAGDLGAELSQAAAAALWKFRFKPAEADGQSVAVRINYTYTFRLER